jgi:DDE superfamily endonuclease
VLTTIGVMPERDGRQFAHTEQRSGEPHEYIIDGTERRRQRPKNPEKQALFYSGKKKTHSDKNVIVVNTRSKRVGYLSPTYAGKTHDKKVADCEKIAYPKRATLHKDTAFQGYEPEGTRTHQPKKSRAGKN